MSSGTSRVGCLNGRQLLCRTAVDIFVLTSAYQGHGVLAVAMANQEELNERLQAYHGTWIKVKMQFYAFLLRLERTLLHSQTVSQRLLQQHVRSSKS